MAALTFRDESGMEVTNPLISCESINPRPFQNVNPGPRTPSGEDRRQVPELLKRPSRLS